MSSPKTVCALGDLLLDVVVTGQGPLRRAADTYSSISVGAGGQAANVCAWVTALGGRARLVAKRVGSPLGQMLEGQLSALGVEVLGPVVAAEGRGCPGVVVSLSGFEAERSMLSDRGVCPQLRADELRAEWFSGCDRLHLPLYSLVDAPIREAAFRARSFCPDLSIDLSSLTVIEQIGPGRVCQVLDELHPDILFGNEAEAAALTLPPIPQVVVKLGGRGVLVNGVRHAAASAEVVDTTGAGDAFAAGFLVGGLELALAAAACAVGRPGAMPLGEFVRP